MNDNLDEYIDDDDSFLDNVLVEMEINKEVEEIFESIQGEDNTIEEDLQVPEIMKEELPKIVQDWEKTALSVSHDNEIPAQVSFFVVLGQLVKDLIRIPNGPNTEDTRIHFCWIQTSGTGKSTLWNFVGPVVTKLHEKINTKERRPNNEGIDEISDDDFTTVRTKQMKYDMFDIVDYTDAALIGFYKDILNEDGEQDWKRYAGALEGNGLAHWDEFEYSGVFKQSQHKEQIIVYLNTLMNTLEGESWVITKKLKEGKIMRCECRRSVFATTYPPKKLAEVIAEKGVLQRMLCYVKHVSEEEQHIMRKKQLKLAGKRTTIDVDTDIFVSKLFEIYEGVKRQYLKEEDPFNTLTYADNFGDALYVEYNKMREHIQNAPLLVKEIAQNFMTRMLKILMKFSVLCCVANSIEEKDPKKKYVVNAGHVRQAYILTQKCYMTLVSWLKLALKPNSKTGSEQIAEIKKKNAILIPFTETYNEMKKDNDGFVSKKELIQLMLEVPINGKIVSQKTVYRMLDKIKSEWTEKNILGLPYIKLKKKKEEDEK